MRSRLVLCRSRFTSQRCSHKRKSRKRHFDRSHVSQRPLGVPQISHAVVPDDQVLCHQARLLGNAFFSSSSAIARVSLRGLYAVFV